MIAQSELPRAAQIACEIVDRFADDDIGTLMAGCIETLAHCVNYASRTGAGRAALLAEIASDIRKVADHYRGH